MPTTTLSADDTRSGYVMKNIGAGTYDGTFFPYESVDTGWISPNEFRGYYAFDASGLPAVYEILTATLSFTASWSGPAVGDYSFAVDTAVTIDAGDLAAMWASGTGDNAIAGHPNTVELSIPSAQLAGLVIAGEAAFKIQHTVVGEIALNFIWIPTVASAELVIHYRTKADPSVSLTSSAAQAVSADSSTGDTESLTSSAGDAQTGTSSAANTQAGTSTVGKTVSLTSSVGSAKTGTSSAGTSASATSSTADTETADSSTGDSVAKTASAGNQVELTSSAANEVALTSSIPERGDL